MRRRVHTLGLIALAATTAMAGTLPATGPATAAEVTHTRTVSANPVNWTPHILDGTVKAAAVVGNMVVLGGTFTKVRNVGSSTVHTRRYIFAFDRRTGKIDWRFKPTVNATVRALAWGPRNSVYVGGSFTTVNGVAHRGLTRLYLDSGWRVGSFVDTKIGDGTVYSLAHRGTKLYVGGSFTRIRTATRVGLARLDHESGRVDSSFKLQISGPRGGGLRVFKLAVNKQHDRLAVIGAFTKVGGQSRVQAAMIRTDVSPAQLATWTAPDYAKACPIDDSLDSYLRDVDFSPDGRYLVIVTTGGPGGDTTLCDSAARYETYRGAGQRPTWVNWTGGDSLYAVSVTGSTVYVGGHQRWLNNPDGHDTAGPGAVSRPGVGALSPTTGRALSWNPTKQLGHGVEELLAYSEGLIMGSDTEWVAGELHPRIAIFPL